MDYTTTETLREYARIPDEADDAYLALAITAASRAIDKATNRAFDNQLETPAERKYEAVGNRVEIDDLFTTSGLIVKVGDTVITDYQLYPLNGNPWTSIVDAQIRGVVTVTARFGWSGVPSAIEQACLLQASRILMRRDAPFGIAGSPETSELRLLAKLDPDVEVLLRPYYRWYGAF